MKFAFNPVMVGEPELSIVAPSPVAEFVPVPFTVPSNSLVFDVEKFTSKSEAFGETEALDLIVTDLKELVQTKA